MNLNPDVPPPTSIIRKDIGLFEPTRHPVSPEDTRIPICQHVVILDAAREDPLDRCRVRAFESTRDWVYKAGRVRRREGEEGLMSWINDIPLGAVRGAGAGSVPFAVTY